MKGLGETSPFHRLLILEVINRFIFGHGVVIFYIFIVSIILIISLLIYFLYSFIIYLFSDYILVILVYKLIKNIFVDNSWCPNYMI